MYRILVDGRVLGDSRKKNYEVASGKLKLKLNNSGGFEFALLSGNPALDYIIPKRSIITLQRNYQEIWRGRAVDLSEDIYGRPTITCDGLLSYLQDSRIGPFEFSGVLRDLFSKIVSEHNAFVDAFKQFQIGTISVSDAWSTVTLKNTRYVSAWSLIQTLIKEHGGQICVETDGNLLYLHWLNDYTRRNTQPIQLGRNLISITKKIVGSDIYTGVFPTGADGLDITSVNNGSKFVLNQSAAAIYGRIFCDKEFKDITDANALLASAEQYVDTLCNPITQIDARAIDMNLSDETIEAIQLGDYLHAVCEPRKVDDWLQAKEITLDIVNPPKSTFTLGLTKTMISKLLAAG